MSTVPFTSMLLWTEKGKTFVPLVRGSSFLVKYDVKGFFQFHVIAAAHCATPARFQKLWPRFTNMEHVRERNTFQRLLLPNGVDGRIAHEVDLRPRFKVIPGFDVALLNMVREEHVAEAIANKGLPALVPFELDVNPIGEGEAVVLRGFDVEEETGDPSGFSLRMHAKELHGVTRAAITTNTGFGTVVLVELEEEMPQGMCGGPVLRKSNGKCIGVIAGKVSPEEPRTDFDLSKEKPVVDPRIVIESLPKLCENPKLRAGFTPLREFYGSMRQHEALQL